MKKRFVILSLIVIWSFVSFAQNERNDKSLPPFTFLKGMAGYTPGQVLGTNDVTITKLDSVVVDLFDKNQGKLMHNWKTAYEYNTKGRPVNETNLFWAAPATGWTAYTKTESKYNTAGKVSEQTIWDWDFLTGKWPLERKSEFTYNTENLLRREVLYVVDSLTGEWKAGWKYEYEYNVFGQQTIFTVFRWSKILGDWDKYFKDEYFYTTKGELSDVVVYTWNFAWIADSRYKYDYVYDTGDVLKEVITSKWSQVAERWFNHEKELLTFDENKNLTSHLFQKWDLAGELWVNKIKTDFTYNKSYLFKNLAIPYTSTNVSIWKMHHINMLTSWTSREWDAANVKWGAEAEKYSYYFSDQIVVPVRENALRPVISVYPNPAGEYLEVSLSAPVTEGVFEILDTQGRTLMSRNLSEGNRISVGHFSSGVYLYRVRTSQDIFSGTVMLKGR